MKNKAIILVLILVIANALSIISVAANTYSKPIIIVDDDGRDCPSADLIGENAIQEAINTGLIEPNGTIIACRGSYRGFTNIVRDFTGQLSIVPVRVVGLGDVRIIYSQSAGISNVILENLTLIISPFIQPVISLRIIKWARMFNVTILAWGDDWGYGEVLVGDGSSLEITSSNIMVLSTTTYNPVIRSNNASYIEISFSNISGSLDLRSNVILFYNNSKDWSGSYNRFTVKCFANPFGWFTCVTLKPHPTVTLVGNNVVVYNNVLRGTIYVKSSNANITRNIFVKDPGKIAYNYNPVDPLGDVFNSGLDFVLVDGNGIIEYNIFKYAGSREPYSNYNISEWAALRVLGVYTIRRNLFYSNKIALIIEAPSLVYDNLFINNEIQAISRQNMDLNIDPPVRGTNIIGGPFLGGNYWSDYKGYDLDGDGLGDIPYTNDYNVIDIHPLVLPGDLAKCPPYMGAMEIINYNHVLYSIVLIAISTTSWIMVSKAEKKHRGLGSIVGVLSGIVLAIAVVIIVSIIVYNPSVSALSKVSAPLIPVGEPHIVSNVLDLTIYNPSDTRVCVEGILVDGHRVPIISNYTLKQPLLSRLEESVLRGESNTIGSIISKAILESRIIAPKSSRRFYGLVQGLDHSIVNVSIIANNGVWQVFASER